MLTAEKKTGEKYVFGFYWQNSFQQKVQKQCLQYWEADKKVLSWSEIFLDFNKKHIFFRLHYVLHLCCDKRIS